MRHLIAALKRLINRLSGPAITAQIDNAQAHSAGGEGPEWRQLTASAWVRPASKDVYMEITTRAAKIKTRVFWFAFGFITGFGIPLALIKIMLEG